MSSRNQKRKVESNSNILVEYDDNCDKSDDNEDPNGMNDKIKSKKQLLKKNKNDKNNDDTESPYAALLSSEICSIDSHTSKKTKVMTKNCTQNPWCLYGLGYYYYIIILSYYYYCYFVIVIVIIIIIIIIIILLLF